MNTGKIVAGIGFILAYGSLMMSESMQKGGSFLQGAASGSYLLVLLVLSIGVAAFTIGLTRAYALNQ